MGSNKLMHWKCSKGHLWTAKPNDRTGRNSGCGTCSNHKLLIGFNDLATSHPEIAKEADGWDPKTVIAGTHEKRKWKCKQGHTWISVVKNRCYGKKSNCPVCSNKKVFIDFNDLATTHPEIAKEADGWDPRSLTSGSGKKVQWKCNLGHSYLSRIGSRTNQKQNCPICSNNQLLVGFNDLATTHPEIAKEADGWDPTTVIAGTHVKKQWKCNKGHTWVARVKSRSYGSKSNCPGCSITGFDPNQNGFLYFLIQPKWEIYQIGITNVPEDRLNRHSKNGFELLELRGPMDGHSAQELETAILRYLKSQQADLSPEHVAGKFDGYSESWTIDSYKVNNLKELIDKASEAGY
jgi:hypothetical protein